MSKSDYYRAWLLGIVCGMSFLSIFYMVNVALDTKELQPQPKSNFEVIEQYKGCDVVRYTPDHSARYTYFLDCKK
jgi:hypothetical protein